MAVDLSQYRFSKEHEWVRLEGNIATIGITEHAAGELGDIVFVELPKVGASFAQDAEFGTIESVKTVSSIYVPLEGVVLEVNDTLVSEPNLVNDSPYDAGWMVKVEVKNLELVQSLMSFSEYNEYLS